MNRAELSNKIIEWSHRSDLAGQIDTFLDNTTSRLNNRLGMALDLTGNNSENVISRDYPNIYIYGGLREMSIYTQDAVAEQGYNTLYNDEVSRLNITAESEAFTDDSPVMLSECEMEVVDAT